MRRLQKVTGGIMMGATGLSVILIIAVIIVMLVVIVLVVKIPSLGNF